MTYPGIVRASWELTPDLTSASRLCIRLSNVGAVVSHRASGTSRAGFGAEWREIAIVTVDGDLTKRCELFDEADLDTALARFDELNRAPELENAATRSRARIADKFNGRDLDGFLAVHDAHARFDDRRKGLRNEGQVGREFARALLFDAPASWRLESQAVAIRGHRLALTREMIRDTDGADRPITIELLMLTEVNDNELASLALSFDPDDISGAMAELTSRWIASGEVAHPEVIDAARRLGEAVNRDGWEPFAVRNADATFINHRQLATPSVKTVGDHLPSMQETASLLPTYRVEMADIPAHSASGLVILMIHKGVSKDGFAIEVPVIALVLLSGDRVTHVENFDLGDRGAAMARFEELSTE